MFTDEDDCRGDYLYDCQKDEQMMRERLGPDPRDEARDEAERAEWLYDERMAELMNRGAKRADAHRAALDILAAGGVTFSRQRRETFRAAAESPDAAYVDRVMAEPIARARRRMVA